VAGKLLGELDVHFHRAFESCAVVNDDPRRAHVALYDGALFDGDRVRGDDVTLDLAVDLDAFDVDVRGDHATCGDDQSPRQGDAPFDAPFDEEVFLAGERSADRNLRAYDATSGA